MLFKLFNVFLKFLMIQTICIVMYTNVSQQNYFDIDQIEKIENLLTVYDLETEIPLKGELIDLKKDGSISTTVYRVKCFYENYTYSCCIGIKFLWIKGPVCVTAGIDRENISIFIKLTMNQNRIFSKSISLKSPEICIKINFKKIHLIKFCIKIHDISISDDNLHFCIDLKIEILFKTKKIQFNCVNIKTKRINWDNFALELEQLDQTKQEVIEFTYDEEDFDLKDLEVYINYISALIPKKEQETVKIRQLEL